ncbi:cell wall hydrolase [Sphingomonas sp. G-3-2-10]|uniref:cell wall hydrolase n=1 Tax=Sphingomonas sp. G-3-2-10 TaxID=2728838 RepID=UPI00146E74C3|nr:cell wall hydrolase [Sphingomonas sp. G-3-2-10]NML06544.1 cell wall hydrolase [Sphingomonas sp. G-3-2-10]
MQARGLAAAAIASLIGAGFSAQALGPGAVGAVKPKIVETGYEAEDHFPGAAYYTAVADDSAEAAEDVAMAGATGTVALPDIPIPAGAVIDESIRPAQPFRLAGSEVDKARALQCLTTAIYYEAANEPDDGQRAVAQVILNRVRHPTFPATVCGVIYQGSERRGCQFSYACDGSMARTPSRTAWLRAQKVAASALNGSVFAPVGLATHYHTYAVTPSWNRTLVMTGVYGAHFFHRWKGYWGTAAAFTQRYRGSEPLPGPHPSATQVATPVPVPTPVATPAQTPRELIRPEYADSGKAKPGFASAAPVATTAAAQGDESQILDRWRDSGKPLR